MSTPIKSCLLDPVTVTTCLVCTRVYWHSAAAHHDGQCVACSGSAASQKIATVTPLWKKRNVGSTDNGRFRSVLNLSIISKVVKLTLASQKEYLSPRFQSVYRKYVTETGRRCCSLRLRDWSDFVMAALSINLVTSLLTYNIHTEIPLRVSDI